jgi:hypothetical protein
MLRPVAVNPEGGLRTLVKKVLTPDMAFTLFLAAAAAAPSLPPPRPQAVAVATVRARIISGASIRMGEQAVRAEAGAVIPVRRKGLVEFQ